VAQFSPDEFLKRLRSVMRLAQGGATEGERTAARIAFQRLVVRANAEAERMRQSDSGLSEMEVDRFLDSVNSLHSASDAPKKARAGRSQAKKSAIPKFRVGEFVIVTGSWRPPEVGQIKKIVNEATNLSYTISMGHDGEVCRTEAFLRLATPEELAVAQAIAKANLDEPRPAWQDTEINVERMAYSTNPNYTNKIFGVLSHGTKTYMFWGIMRKALSIKCEGLEAADGLFRLKLDQGYSELARTQISGMASWLVPDLNLAIKVDSTNAYATAPRGERRRRRWRRAVKVDVGSPAARNWSQQLAPARPI
jgi:hypothetical protein